MNSDLAICVERLTKRFHERVAFEDVSFEVGHGEVFGFLGPNGAGKTTTVRTLGTLLKPTSGRAIVAGLELREDNGVEIRQRISIMPESPGLYGRLSVAENLECFAGLYGITDPKARIEASLRVVNLLDRANDPCQSLSKGLRQRVGLARALLSDPVVLFLDEPTSGLDPVATREVNELIDGLRRRGVTIFLTTHRLVEAERLCDRVAILNTRLRLIGTPDELRACLFTKSLDVRTRDPLADADHVFNGLLGVESYEEVSPGSYVLTVTDPAKSAPDVTRALVAAQADVLSIAESHHSLEDVYLELIDEDVEAQRVDEIQRMKFNRVRVFAITKKELRDYRHNRFIVFTMSVVPLIFVVLPTVQLFTIRTAATSSTISTRVGLSLFYMLLIPAIVPSALAAYSIVGEREQGTLEPVLTTPIRKEEFLLGKASAILVPTLAIAYLIFGIFYLCAGLFAVEVVRSAVFEPAHVLAQLLFTPLLAAWSIWVGIAISARSSDVRVAEQLGTFASLPPLAIVALISFNVIAPSLGIVLALAAALFVIDAFGWRAISTMFDRERLVSART